MTLFLGKFAEICPDSSPVWQVINTACLVAYTALITHNLSIKFKLSHNSLIWIKSGTH
jgi:hypothetical protein